MTLDAGIKTSDGYTVGDAARDWLEKGTRDLDERTVETYRILIEKHLVSEIGAIKLKKLNANHVDDWLDGLADELSTASLHKLHSALKRAIRQAQARDMVGRNVAELVTTPRGRQGRPSKALTLDQAVAVLAQARTHWLYAYVASQPPDRRADRGSTRSPVVTCRGLGQRRPAMAVGHPGRLRPRKARGLRLALSPRRRRHQDPEVPPDTGSPRRGSQGAATAPQEAGGQATQGRRDLARSRPGLLHQERQTTRRGQRPPSLPHPSPKPPA